MRQTLWNWVESSMQESSQEGSTTVEYAIGAVAAAAFAGMLLAIVRSDAVRSALEGIITQALHVL